LRRTVGRDRLRAGVAGAVGRWRLRAAVVRDRLRAAVGGNGCVRELRQAVEPALGPDR
jgi:hypothetical protein